MKSRAALRNQDLAPQQGGNAIDTQVGSSSQTGDAAMRELLLRALRLYRLDPGLALHRAAEAALVRRALPTGPLLEVGCHDGTFATLALEGLVPIADRIGCDLDPDGLFEARASFAQVMAADGARLPLQDKAFSTAVCNSVLAHVADLPACLAELRRVLRADGRLIASVPTPRFHAWFAPARALRALGFKDTAAALSQRYDQRWQQRHVLDRPQWDELLTQAGLRLEVWTEYFDARSSWTWSSWFMAWRAGMGRATVGAVARRLFPANTTPTRYVERWLARRLSTHARPLAAGGGSAWFLAVRRSDDE